MTDASVLLCKKRACAEIYNDFDVDIANLLHVLRNDGQICQSDTPVGAGLAVEGIRYGNCASPNNRAL